MTINMMHNDNIKTFEDIKHHLELEEDHLDVTKYSDQAYMTEAGPSRFSGYKLKKDRKPYKKDKRTG